MALPQTGVRLTVDGLNKFLADLNSARQSIADFSKLSGSASITIPPPDTSKFASGFSGLSQIVTGAFREIGALAVDGAVQLGASVADAIKSSIQTSIAEAADLQQQVANIAASPFADPGKAKEYGSIIKDIALDPKLVVGFEEAGSAALALTRNSVGFDQLNESLKTTVLLQNQIGQTGTTQEFERTAQVVARVGNIFDLTGSQIKDAADQIPVVVGSGFRSIQDYYYALSSAGEVAAAQGVKFGEFNKFLALTAQGFSSGRTDATGFAAFINKLSPDTDKAANAMDELGLSFYDAAGNFVGTDETLKRLQQTFNGTITSTKAVTGRTDEQQKEYERLGATIKKYSEQVRDLQSGVIGANLTDEQRARRLSELQSQLSAAQGEYAKLDSITTKYTTTQRKLTQQERQDYLQKIFGTEAGRFVTTLLDVTDAQEKQVDSLLKSADAETTAAIRTETLKSKWANLQDQALALGASFGEPLLSPLTQLVSAAGQVIPALAPIATSLGQSLANIIQPLADAATSFAAGFTDKLAKIGDAGAKLGEVLRAAFDAFKESGLIGKVADQIYALIDGVETRVAALFSGGFDIPGFDLSSLSLPSFSLPEFAATSIPDFSSVAKQIPQAPFDLSAIGFDASKFGLLDTVSSGLNKLGGALSGFATTTAGSTDKAENGLLGLSAGLTGLSLLTPTGPIVALSALAGGISALQVSLNNADPSKLSTLATTVKTALNSLGEIVLDPLKALGNTDGITSVSTALDTLVHSPFLAVSSAINLVATSIQTANGVIETAREPLKFVGATIAEIVSQIGDAISAVPADQAMAVGASLSNVISSTLGALTSLASIGGETLTPVTASISSTIQSLLGLITNVTAGIDGKQVGDSAATLVGTVINVIADQLRATDVPGLVGAAAQFVATASGKLFDATAALAESGQIYDSMANLTKVIGSSLYATVTDPQLGRNIGASLANFSGVVLSGLTAGLNAVGAVIQNTSPKAIIGAFGTFFSNLFDGFIDVINGQKFTSLLDQFSESFLKATGLVSPEQAKTEVSRQSAERKQNVDLSSAIASQQAAVASATTPEERATAQANLDALLNQQAERAKMLGQAAMGGGLSTIQSQDQLFQQQALETPRSTAGRAFLGQQKKGLLDLTGQSGDVGLGATELIGALDKVAQLREQQISNPEQAGKIEAEISALYSAITQFIDTQGALFDKNAVEAITNQALVKIASTTPITPSTGIVTQSTGLPLGVAAPAITPALQPTTGIPIGVAAPQISGANPLVFNQPQTNLTAPIIENPQQFLATAINGAISAQQATSGSTTIQAGNVTLNANAAVTGRGPTQTDSLGETLAATSAATGQALSNASAATGQVLADASATLGQTLTDAAAQVTQTAAQQPVASTGPITASGAVTVPPIEPASLFPKFDWKAIVPAVDLGKFVSKVDLTKFATPVYLSDYVIGVNLADYITYGPTTTPPLQSGGGFGGGTTTPTARSTTPGVIPSTGAARTSFNIPVGVAAPQPTDTESAQQVIANAIGNALADRRTNTQPVASTGPITATGSITVPPLNATELFPKFDWKSFVTPVDLGKSVSRVDLTKFATPVDLNNYVVGINLADFVIGTPTTTPTTPAQSGYTPKAGDTITTTTTTTNTTVVVGKAAGDKNFKGGRFIGGELGPELAVTQDKHTLLIGADGPAPYTLPSGSVIYPHDVTEKLLHGPAKTPVRLNRAFASGTGLPLPKHNIPAMSIAAGDKNFKGGRFIGGELGPELAVTPDKHTLLIGADGPAPYSLPSGSVIYPHDVTEKLLSGTVQTPVRLNRAFASGTDSPFSGISTPVTIDKIEQIARQNNRGSTQTSKSSAAVLIDPFAVKTTENNQQDRALLTRYVLPISQTKLVSPVDRGGRGGGVTYQDNRTVTENRYYQLAVESTQSTGTVISDFQLLNTLAG